MIGQELEYSDGTVKMKGFLAYEDTIAKKRPGVLVVHEWWGHNDYARKRARMLAEIGYTAFAVDMYGNGQQASHPDDAGKFSREITENMDIARVRFQAGLDFLKLHKTVDPQRIAAIGYCFGGRLVLNMARMGLDLDGVASFHGHLSTSKLAKPGEVKAAVLVCHGADDEFITRDEIETFKKEMENASVGFQFVPYEGAKHSFTNPQADEYAKKFSLALAYNAQADQNSWSELSRFLSRIFSKKN